MPNTLPPDAPRAPRDAARPRRVSSDELLQGETELLITHARDLYRLRATRQGKLVLTK